MVNRLSERVGKTGGIWGFETTEGIAAAEAAWRGGIADLGDTTAAQLVQRMPGYAEYRKTLVSAIKRKHGSKWTMYRAMGAEEWEDYEASALGSEGAGWTFNRRLAQAWANVAAGKKAVRVVVRGVVDLSAVIMRGKEEELELVLHNGDVQNIEPLDKREVNNALANAQPRFGRVFVPSVGMTNKLGMGITGRVLNRYLVAAEDELSDLAFAIARMEEQAQNAEDRGQDGRASSFRAKARNYKAQLDAMLAKKREASSALADQAVRSRFEEGKPADPTQNMDPEDAKEWDSENERNKDRFKKTAGWSGYGPMDGDQPLDLLLEVSKLNPIKAAAVVLRSLESRNFTDSYAAMGVWDVVMSSDAEPYVQAFSQLKDDVQKAARNVPEDEDEWHESPEVQKFLASYQSGRPTGKLRVEFAPEIKGAWYLRSCDAQAGDGVEIDAVMVNQYSKERKRISESFGVPRDVSFEDVKVELYNQKGDSQQSLLMTATDENGDEWEIQIEFDSVIGDLHEKANQRAQWEKVDSSW